MILSTDWLDRRCRNSTTWRGNSFKGAIFQCLRDCSSDFQAKQAAKSIKNGSLFDPFIIQTDTFQTCTNSSQCTKNADYSAITKLDIFCRSAIKECNGSKIDLVFFFCIILPSQKCSSDNFHIALFYLLWHTVKTHTELALKVLSNWTGWKRRREGGKLPIIESSCYISEKLRSLLGPQPGRYKRWWGSNQRLSLELLVFFGPMSIHIEAFRLKMESLFTEI